MIRGTTHHTVFDCGGFTISVRRIIDANANRAREALRVLEDAARFMLDHADLTHRFKTTRHELTRAINDLPDLLAARATTDDVGTGISTPSEAARGDLHVVLAAAGSRLGEALRSIEEYTKLIDPDIAQRIERLRYDSYTLVQDLLGRIGPAVMPPWRLCVLFSEDGCAGRPWRDVLQRIIDAEPDCIQLREKHLDDRTLLDRARWLVEHAASATAVIINDRPDIARLAGAHGVHVGQGDVSALEARQIVGPDRIVGVSTANLDEARAARRDGAGYVGVGPIFSSTTKPKLDHPRVGLETIRAYAAWNGLPHLAISGITLENLDDVLAAGAHGVAVSAAICAAADPGQIVATIQRRVGAGRTMHESRVVADE